MKLHTLRPGVHLTRVFLYRDVVDFRRGHRGLATLIEHELGHDPFSGALYIFANRQRNKNQRIVLGRERLRTLLQGIG